MGRLILKPQWVWGIGALAVVAPILVGALHVVGLLPHSQRNLVPLSVLGAALVVGILYISLMLEFPEHARPLPSRLGIVLLTGFALGLVALQVRHYWALFTLPQDLGGWSEQLFMMDITKWASGSQLYLPAYESNSSPYTPGAPALSYAIARLFGADGSIPFYRLLQQVFLLLGAGAGAAAAGNMSCLWRGAARPVFPWQWIPFFGLTMYLMALNPQTGAFNIYLHNDPLAICFSMLAFCVATLHARRPSTLGLLVMAVLPAAGFLIKQYLAIWAAAYAVFLWLDGRTSWRTLVAYCAGAFGILFLVIGGGIWVGGDNYRYWVFESLGAETVFYRRLIDRFTEASLYLLPGLAILFLGGAGEARRRILALWSIWVVLFWAGLYSSGITYSPTHLGPATLVGFCFLLALLASAWPGRGTLDAATDSRVLPAGASIILIIFLLAAFGFTALGGLHRSPDYARYVNEIEREFADMDAGKVLIDHGEWLYMQRRVVQRDRSGSVLVPRDRRTGIYDRLRRREYARVLVREVAPGLFLYDVGGDRGIGKVLLEHYKEVRRIKGVRGMENWRYARQTLCDVVVFEPRVASGEAAPPASSSRLP